MSLLHDLVYPSIWMQKTFFQIEESNRGVPIGDSSWVEEGLSLEIRVVAVAHAVLQCCFATVIAIPLLVGCAIHMIASQEDSEISQFFLERFGKTVLFALGAIIMPVTSSIVCAIDPGQLNDDMNDDMKEPLYPVAMHVLFFTHTLPSLSSLRYMVQQRAEELQARRGAPGLRGFISRMARRATSAVADRALSFLQCQERTLDYRMEIARILFEKIRLTGFSTYDQSLRINSADFAIACGVVAGGVAFS